MKTITQVFVALLISASLTSKALSQNQPSKQPDTTSTVTITAMASLVQDLLNTNNALQKRLDSLEKKYDKRLENIIRDSPPVGTILAFGGSEKAVLPDGWMFCYGNALSSKEYKLLYDKIGTSWGNGKQGKGFNFTTDFNIPDLRGLFLRGVGGEADVNPEKDNRISRFNGLSGNNVGSFQNWATHMPKNAFKIENSGKHQHTMRTYTKQQRKSNSNNSNDDDAWVGITDNDLTPNNDLSLHSHPILGGDQETRPVNVYVNYIIKVK